MQSLLVEPRLTDLLDLVDDYKQTEYAKLVLPFVRWLLEKVDGRFWGTAKYLFAKAWLTAVQDGHVFVGVFRDHKPGSALFVLEVYGNLTGFLFIRENVGVNNLDLELEFRPPKIKQYTDRVIHGVRRQSLLAYEEVTYVYHFFDELISLARRGGNGTDPRVVSVTLFSHRRWE